MLDLLAGLLTGRGRARVDVATAPADVLLQSAIVLRNLGAIIARLDLDEGTLEARLATGAPLRLRAAADGGGSRVAIAVDGRDWAGVARTLARELERGAAA
ncbi:MAG TPA: hypothetical protein VGR82_01830 [Methylomirabilota bacterium]|jgi:hypothetical protein|nr:hypothetical protein [Methylomirabilota bacterium]